MTHCTPDELALASLDEPLPADAAVHLAGCERCTDDLRSLRRATDPIRALPTPASAPPLTPPPAVWAAIASATGVSGTPRPAVASRPAGGPVADPVPLRRHAVRRPRRLLAVAATLVASIGLGAVGVTLADRDTDRSTLATARLDAWQGADASGQATMLRGDDDRRELQVQLSAPGVPGSYYEVWLLDPDTLRMIALGVVDGGTTVLDVPDGLDVSRYSVVDVSLETWDGDPTHSATSVARGQL